MNSMVFVAIFLAYLVGSLPFGLLVARWFGGIDIRQHGSGNIGATNVGRTMGFRWFVVVFMLDGLKGMLPTLLTLLIIRRFDPAGGTIAAPILAGLAAILGHMFPCWLKFRGGKGVATALGVVLVLAPTASLITAVVFGVSFALWRTVSLSSMIAAIWFGVLQMFLIRPSPLAADAWPLTLFSLGVPLLIVYRHRNNIVRLLRGEEHAFRSQNAPDLKATGNSDCIPDANIDANADANAVANRDTASRASQLEAGSELQS